MNKVERNDVSIYIQKKDYKDVDIKCLGYIDAFMQKYMKQHYGKSFNGGLDKISSASWAEIMGDLQTVYEAKWKEQLTPFKDMVDRTLPRYEDPLIKAVNEL